MNEIILNRRTLPRYESSGLLAAAEPFYHVDRVADFNVMIYVLEGTIYVTEEGQDQEIGSGELLFLKSGIRHYGKREIPQGTRWFYAHFYYDAAGGGNTKPLPKKLSGLSGTETERRILAFNSFASSSEPNKEWYLDLRLAELLTFLALGENCLSAAESLSGRIAEFLRENVSSPFSSAALEREFYLSYKRMAAVFKAETGMSMQQYHDGLKMSAAKELLRSTLMPVGEVASAVGYSDRLYFSRRFRELTGIGPTEFRKKASRSF